MNIQIPGMGIEQSNISTISVFFIALGALYFFESIFGFRGFFRVAAALTVSLAYRFYWSHLWGAVVSLMEGLGLTIG